MDGHQFDGLAKLLATQPSRRQVIKVLGASALGGLFATFRVAGAQVVRCDPEACAAEAAGNACVTCRCQGIPGQGRGVQECVCTELQCPEGTHCCPAGKKAGRCVRGACP